MKRKEFLKLSGAGVAAIGSGLAGPEKKKQSAVRTSPFSDGTLKKGFMLGTFPDGESYSIDQKFRILKEAGFIGIEPPSGLDRAEVLEAKEKYSLEIPSVVVSTHWSSPLSSPDANVRRTGLSGLENALYDAEAYGATTILLVPGVVNEEVSYSQCYERSQREIRKMIPLAEELDIVIAIENVWNHFLLSPLEAARYVDEFESAHTGWYFDIGNIMNYGWPSHWIRTLGERIAMIHIKEFSRQKRNDEGLWNGFRVHYMEGDNDWPEIMKALKEVGYSGYAVAEPSYRGEGLSAETFTSDYVAARMGRMFEYYS